MTRPALCDSLPLRHSLRAFHRPFALLVILLLPLTQLAPASTAVFRPIAATNISSTTATQGEQDIRPLELGKPFDRKLEGGQSHAKSVYAN